MRTKRQEKSKLWGPALGLGRKITRFLDFVKSVQEYSPIIYISFIKNDNKLSEIMA